jgi:hypothetical protein
MAEKEQRISPAAATETTFLAVTVFYYLIT